MTVVSVRQKVIEETMINKLGWLSKTIWQKKIDLVILVDCY